MSIAEWLNDPNGDGNTEAAPENPPKRKRGRPRITSPGWDSMAPIFFGRKSPRTYRNNSHAQRAIEVLTNTTDPGFAYLIGETYTRRGILAELGQLSDDDEIREAAIAICEHKLKTKDAITLLRRSRNGKSAPGDTVALAEEIGRVIRSYKLRHPDVTSEQVRSALMHVVQLNDVSRSSGAEAPALSHAEVAGETIDKLEPPITNRQLEEQPDLPETLDGDKCMQDGMVWPTG